MVKTSVPWHILQHKFCASSPTEYFARRICYLLVALLKLLQNMTSVQFHGILCTITFCGSLRTCTLTEQNLAKPEVRYLPVALPLVLQNMAHDTDFSAVAYIAREFIKHFRLLIH